MDKRALAKAQHDDAAAHALAQLLADSVACGLLNRQVSLLCTVVYNTRQWYRSLSISSVQYTTMAQVSLLHTAVYNIRQWYAILVSLAPIYSSVQYQTMVHNISI